MEARLEREETGNRGQDKKINAAVQRGASQPCAPNGAGGLAKPEVLMLSTLVAVVVVSAVSGVTPPEASGKPVVAAVEVDAGGLTSERTSMMRREIAINEHKQERAACNTNIAFDTDPPDTTRVAWVGRCFTLAECKAACTAGTKLAGCTHFNWWPIKGGCRHTKGSITSRVTSNWTTVSGEPSCTEDSLGSIFTQGPTDCTECSSKCISRQCSAHPQCTGLAGDCCPTPQGVNLACCERVYNESRMNELCSAHPRCAHLAGPYCCPVPSGGNLECCDD